MVMGVTFLIVAGIDLGYQVLWVNDTGECYVMFVFPDIFGNLI